MNLDKLTILGDPHIVKKHLDKSAKLFDQAEALGQPILLLGDQLDTKSVIDGYCLNFLYKRLSQSKLTWIMLVGNHDLYDLNVNENHSLEVFKALPNVTVVDQLTELDSYYFLPYIHSSEKLRSALAAVPKGSTIFGHFAISGFDYGNGHVCDSDVPDHSFKKFKRVISGHFHLRQDKGNIHYIGTGFSHDFGESNQQKFIAVLDREADTLSHVPTEFVKHVTLQLDFSNPSLIESVQAQAQELAAAGNTVRIVAKGAASELAQLPRLEGVRYDEKPTEEEAVLVAESDNHLNQFKEWAETKKMDAAVISLGLAFITEAQR